MEQQQQQKMGKKMQLTHQYNVTVNKRHIRHSRWNYVNVGSEVILVAFDLVVAVLILSVSLHHYPSFSLCFSCISRMQCRIGSIEMWKIEPKKKLIPWSLINALLLFSSTSLNYNENVMFVHSPLPSNWYIRKFTDEMIDSWLADTIRNMHD